MKNYKISHPTGILSEDVAHVSGDNGIMALTVRCDDICALAGADGDYQPIATNEHGVLRTQAQQHYHIEECGAITGWTVLGNDTTSLATTTNHIFGTVALEFDKVNGAANTVFAGIQKTLTSIDLTPYHKGGGFFLAKYYVSDIDDVDYLFLRLGTNGSNYNEWQVSADNLSVGWNSIRFPMASPDAITSNGWNSAAVTYIAVGVAFGVETDTLADIAIDHISANTGLLTSADIAATITSEVSTPNINLLKVGNKVVNTQAGNVGTGTQRITIATDDVNLAAISAGFAAESSALGSGILLQGDDGTDRTNVLVDTAGHLQVDVLSGGGGGTLVIDNEVVDGADTGILVLGTDGSNYQIVSTDASGHLQVDVLSGGGAGTQYTEDAVAPADPVGGTIMITRDDQIGAVTEAEGDWSRLRGTAKGALWVALADASGDPITSFGGGTEYTEDVATANPQVGKAIMMERDDALTTVTPVEGDWIGTRGTAEGALWVQDFNSDTIAGDTTSIDGKITACNTGAVVLAAGTALACDVGLMGNTAVNGSGSDLHTLIDAAGHLQIDVVSAPSTAVTNAGTFAVQIADTSFAVADGNALGEGVLIQGDDGTDRKNIHVDATTGDVQVDVTNAVTVDLGGNNDVTVTSGAITETNSGTIAGDTTSIDGKITACNTGAVVLAAGTAVFGKLAANDGVDIGNVDVASIANVTMSNAGMQITGDEAHDAADAGNPVKVGHKAVLFNSSAPPNAAAAENDRVNSIADEYGRQYVETTHPNYWDVSADYAGAQTNATVKAAPGASLSLYLTDIVISNGATAGNITLLDGSGGTVLIEIYPAINGGLSTNLRTPIKLTANTLLAITSVTCTTHTIFVSGFTAP